MKNEIEVQTLLKGENFTHLLSLSSQRTDKEQISKIEKAFLAKQQLAGENAGPLNTVTLRFKQGDDSTSKMLMDGFTGLQIDLETLNVIYPSEWKGWILHLQGVVLH